MLVTAAAAQMATVKTGGSTAVSKDTSLVHFQPSMLLCGVQRNC
jgi:hypothetical protein